MKVVILAGGYGTRLMERAFLSNNQIKSGLPFYENRNADSALPGNHRIGFPMACLFPPFIERKYAADRERLKSAHPSAKWRTILKSNCISGFFVIFVATK